LHSNEGKVKFTFKFKNGDLIYLAMASIMNE
jgi:hypothetical protein